MEAVRRRVDGGLTLNAAITEVVPKSRRSWVMRHWKEYRREGWEALIDRRTGREPRVTKGCQDLVIGARLADGGLSVEAMWQILEKTKGGELPSESVIKRLFARADRKRTPEKSKSAGEGARTGSAPRRQEAVQVVELEWAGGELVLAAEMETQAVEGLVDAVCELGEQARQEAQGQEHKPERGLRDTKGKFTGAYNRARRRKAGESVASYLRPAWEKGQQKAADWPRFVHERRETVRRKLMVLVLEPLVSRTRGWAGLRGPEMAGLEALAGYAYMPSTVSKLASALAQSTGGEVLLDRLGHRWNEVAQRYWGESGAMAALYVDNHVKPVWSSQYTLSGKVSRLNRVMPSITTTYVQTGAGTPVLVWVNSGTTSLASRLLEAVEEAEQSLETQIERAVVIDAEGSVFDILEACQGKRVIVTPLKPGRAGQVEVHYSRGSYYRPFREGDELRVARVRLSHKSTGRVLDLHALLVRRRHRAVDTVLLTTGVEMGYRGADLAALYYRRWPLQENAFREGGAVKLGRHRGNSGQIVSNVAVVTELEKGELRAKALEDKLQKLRAQKETLAEQVKQSEREAGQAQRSLQRWEQRVERLQDSPSPSGPQGDRVALSYHQAQKEARAAESARERAQREQRQNQEAEQKAAKQLEQERAQAKALESRRTIRQIDVALDTVLTAFKLTAAQLVAFVLRVYLVAMPMTAETFVARVFRLRGRRETGAEEQRVVFYENPRDPQVNAAVADACKRLNAYGFVRDGKRVFYEIRPPPSAVPRGTQFG